MDKEYLLSKGVSEEVADEIISAFDDDTEDDAVLSLQKALNGDSGQESLFKAEDNDEDDKGNGKEGEDDEDEDDEEKDMKKKMKKYMKENPKMCKKFMKELGGFEEKEEKMEKAANDLLDVEDNIVEVADISPILLAQKESIQALFKAVGYLADNVEVIAKRSEESFDLMQKAARVTLEQTKLMQAETSQPSGRKGVIVSDMQKARGDSITFSKEDSAAVYSVLMKAVQNRDSKAGEIISMYESHGKDLRALNDEARQYVAELIKKEGK